MINLFINYYQDPDPERNQELTECLLRNMKNALINMIYLFCNDQTDLTQEMRNLNNQIDKLYYSPLQERPTYNHFFTLMNKFMAGDVVNILANSDIFFDESLKWINDKSRCHFANEKTVFALSRWDITKKSITAVRTANSLKHFDRWDSQDAWIFFGEAAVLSGADFTLGQAGCDNKIAYLLDQAGYNVVNPSRSIRAIHLHEIGIRRYDPSKDRLKIKPPFKLITPCFITDLPLLK